MKNKKHKKINYNPFKMIGSWIGLVIGFFGILFYETITNIYGDINLILAQYPPWSPVIILSGIFGFLLGWIIESLIKYLKYKK